MRRAAKYKRISRDREGRQLGIQRQDEDLDLLAKRRGLTIVADYFDNDLSASAYAKRPRTDYQRLLADAREGKFEVIIAYTTGRLTRTPREFEDLIDLAVDYGIEFEFVRSPSFDLRTAQGREIARTMAARDAGEAEELAERVQREKIQAALNGEWRGGRRPYGYGVQIGTKKAYDRVTGEWVDRPVYDCYQLREDEAEEIRNATRAVILGASLRSLAADMNRRGKVTSTGRPWTATELRKVLRRGRNAGLIEVRQEDGTLAVLEGVQAKWPAIVDEAEWRACLAVLDDPDRRTNRSNIARRWLGSGFYRCGVCGSTVRATRAAVRGTGYMTYRCERRSEQGRHHVTRRADHTDSFVEKTIIRWLSSPKAAARLRRDTGPDVVALQAEAKALRRRLDEADEMFAAGELDRRRLAKISKDVRARLDVVEEQIAAAAEVSPLTQVVGMADVAAAWRELDIPRRQAIIDLVAEVVLLPAKGKGRPPGWRPGEPYFDPETVEFRWR